MLQIIMAGSSFQDGIAWHDISILTEEVNRKS